MLQQQKSKGVDIMINMYDVAEKAGVSKATVSRVLNGKSVVSPEATEKVLAACKELNYKLNYNIQDFILKTRNGSTRNIAFVVVGINFADPAYARLVDGISSAINKYHYHLTLVKLTGKEESIYDLPPVLRDERVDGILISGRLEPNIIGLMKTLGMQCVVIGNYSEQLLGSMSSVQISLGLPVVEAVEQLVKQGKKRIAFADEEPDNHSAKVFFDGYKQALGTSGLKFDESICYFGHGVFSGIFNVMKPVFRRKELPFDSILCYDLRIAREISHLVMGHFGLDREITVTIATIRQHDYYELPVPTIYVDLKLEKCVEAAFQLLVDQIEGKKKSQTVVVK